MRPRPATRVDRRSDFVKARIGHDARDQRRVHGMAGPFRHHVTEQRLADQRQIADQIEDLVAAALVREAQSRPDS